MRPQFTLAELVSQMEQVSPLGPLARRMIRRAGLPDVDVAELMAQTRRMRGILHAMTALEREDPERLDSSRRRRIAGGAGVPVTEVSQLIRQYTIMREMMTQVHSWNSPQKFAAVLALVTGNPFHRDPSGVYPLPERRPLTLYEVTTGFLAVCTFIVIAYVALQRG